MRLAITTTVLLLVANAAAAAQTIGAGGIRAGGAVIHSRDVHAPGAEVDAGGVRVSGAPRGAVSFLRNGVTGARDCRGGEATIAGNRNHLTLRNCRRLSVEGNDNVLTVRLLPPAVIDVPGNRNRVRYSTPPGARPRVSVLGTAVTVERLP